MPFEYVRGLAGRDRTSSRNRHLGFVLAFVAGAVNAGAFISVHLYTSHMTGVVSSLADSLALGEFTAALGAVGALVGFVSGAATSAVMVNYSRRRHQHSEFALPLFLEGFLLLLFGLLGGQLAMVPGLFVPMTVFLLCYIMGLQNALITKISGAEIRTTHLTGVITDMGIELGKLFYWNSTADPGQPPVLANRRRLRMLSILAGVFLAGGVTGALGFKSFGYLATIPLATILFGLAVLPMLDDLRRVPLRPDGSNPR